MESRLAQQPCALAVAADDRVEHVESHVEHSGGNGGGERDAALTHGLGEGRITA